LTRAALVLLADHELNVSAFTLRCAISARAPLHSAIAAALAALQGPRHGGMVTKAGRLIDEIAVDEDPERAIAALKRRLKRGDDLPGFGHPLYSNGDIRAKTLIDLMDRIMPQDKGLKCARVLIDAVAQASGERPNIDFSLAILGRALGFPDGFGVALFAVARSAGWIAHAIEQSAQPDLIRPRARYIGPLPQS